MLKKIRYKLMMIFRRLRYYFSKIVFSIFAPRVVCNICGWKDYRFNSDSWHPYTVCPHCYTQVRHRLFWAILNGHEKYSVQNLLKNKAVLHFAPEKELCSRVKSLCREYKTADYFAEGYHYEGIDFNTDISDMKSIGNELFDCVIAFDVLEHVTDDKKAIREINRILKSGGVAVFTVPQKDNLKITYEDPAIVAPEEREKAFGQFDHLRIYGEDFSDRVASQGFRVEFADEKIFDAAVTRKHVLFPPVLSAHPLATNHRKVYFAVKQN